MLSVSASSIQSYLTCPTQWYFRYVRKISCREFSPSLIRGEVAHALIEAALKEIKNKKSVRLHTCATFVIENVIPNILQREQSKALLGMFDLEAFNLAVSNGMDIGYYFIEYVLPTLDWEVIDVEIPFSRNMSYNAKDVYVIKGVVDALIMTQGRLLIVDHKTYTRIPKETRDGFNIQLLLYLAMLRDSSIQLGDGHHEFFTKEIVRMLDDNPLPHLMLNILSATSPAEPKILKNGSLSKDKSQRTSKAAYMAEMIIQQVQNDPAYLTVYDSLDDDRFHILQEQTPTLGQIDWVWDIIYNCTTEMVKGIEHPEQLLPGNPMTCTYCEYASICEKMREEGNTPDVASVDVLQFVQDIDYNEDL